MVSNMWVIAPYLMMCVMYIVLIAHLVLYEPKDRQYILDSRLKFWSLDGKFNEVYVYTSCAFILAMIGTDLIQDPTIIMMHLKDIATGMLSVLGYTWLAVLVYKLLKLLLTLLRNKE